jgi:predicted acyl esterase
VTDPVVSPEQSTKADVQVETRIRMDDGIELAASLYLPDGASGPQPCILEALPYRKDDLTASYRPDYVRSAMSTDTP